MSKSKNPTKILKTALNRLQKGWAKGEWVKREDDNVSCCIQGAIFGYHTTSNSDAQRKAHELVWQVVQERDPEALSIPQWNDQVDRTQEEVLEVVKTAIIRSETGGLIDEDEFL
jgi:hypothetical protein